jgi:ankyrin repeat protein
MTRPAWISRSLILALLISGGAVIVSAQDRLIDATKKHDRAAVRVLLQQHADPNSAEPDGTTALHWAAYFDDVETAKLLIDYRANVTAVNRQGVAPLSLVCLNGDPVFVDLLLKSGADADRSLPKGEAALMTCSRTGSAESVKLLLAHGANVNAKESWRGQTALMWAAAEGHVAVVQALVNAGADLRARSNGGFTALLFAVREGKLDVVRALLKAGVDVNEATLPPPNARQRGAGGGDTGEAAGGTSALVLAVANAHFELASFLLDAGADPNLAAQGWTALHQITWVRSPGSGDNPPAPEGSGNMDSLELVERLVNHGANVNARMTKKAVMGSPGTDLNNIGATPFLLAARAADLELMRLLLRLGADPLLPNADATTPLLAAAGVGTHAPGEDAGTESDALEAVKLTYELGGNINAVDNNGETAMHGAAYKQFPNVVRFLAKNGANPDVWNKKDRSGWTPLTIAEGVQRGNNLRISLPTAAAIREALEAGGGASIDHSK